HSVNIACSARHSVYIDPHTNPTGNRTAGRMRKMKLAAAAIAIGIITAGLCDDPANAGTMEDAGILAIAATTCQQNVPDAIFMPVVQRVAIENNINVADAIKLIVAQAQIMQ